MSKIFVFCLVSALVAATIALPPELDNVTADSDVNKLWELFKTEFSKTYTGEEDEKKHFAEFQKSVELIAAHNPKFEAGEVSYKLGINDFSDRLPEERPGGGIVLPELTSGGIRG